MKRRVKIRLVARVLSDPRSLLLAVEDCAQKGGVERSTAAPLRQPGKGAVPGQAQEVLETKAAIEVGKLLWKKETAAKPQDQKPSAPRPAPPIGEVRGGLIHAIEEGERAGWKVGVWVVVDPA
jgi:hypothetical protein